MSQPILLPEPIDGMIETTKGMLPVDSLECRRGHVDNDNEITHWVEYWLDGELVHRSVHVHLKKGLDMEMLQASFA